MQTDIIYVLFNLDIIVKAIKTENGTNLKNVAFTRLCSPGYLFTGAQTLIIGNILSFTQQLLKIQEELNNKKSELERAREEHAHTQAMLKILQEQVGLACRNRAWICTGSLDPGPAVTCGIVRRGNSCSHKPTLDLRVGMNVSSFCLSVTTPNLNPAPHVY